MKTIRVLADVKDSVGVVAGLKACMIEMMYNFLVVRVKCLRIPIRGGERRYCNRVTWKVLLVLYWGFETVTRSAMTIKTCARRGREQDFHVFV